MKSNTKKILLATGGIVGGVVVASTGGGFLGLAIGGLLVRAGVLKAAPTASNELVKLMTRGSIIASNAIRGTACTAAGIAISSRSGKMLGEAIAERQEKASIVAPPPSVSRQVDETQAIEN